MIDDWSGRPDEPGGTQTTDEAVRSSLCQIGHGFAKWPIGQPIRGQFIRCSTSVASNYRAACLAQSKAQFTSKLSIVAEEADASAFWLEFIIEENLLEGPRVAPLLNEANELARIFISGRKTAKDRGAEFNNQ